MNAPFKSLKTNRRGFLIGAAMVGGSLVIGPVETFAADAPQTDVGDFGAFIRIALPTVGSGLIASAIFCVMFSWNDFLYAMFLTKADTKTISVALLSAYGTKDISWGTLGALAHFSTLPIVAMMMVLNRYFVQGLTQGVH